MKTIWLAALTFLFVELGISVIAVRKHGPDWVQAQIVREANATRTANAQAIADTRRDLMTEAGSLRADTFKRVDVGLALANQQLTAVRLEVNTQAADVTGKLDGQLSKANVSVAKVTDSLATAIDSLAVVERDAHALIDENHGQVSGAIGSTAEAVKVAGEQFTKAAPAVVEGVKDIEADVQKVTSDFVRPKGFWSKLRYWFVRKIL